MDGRGGCCIARYVQGAYDMSKVDRIMLRFRPIAPKPVAGATTNSDGSSSESSDAFSKAYGRTKRKYVRDKNNNNRRTRRRKSTSSPENNRTAPVVTLSLLPETPDPKEAHNNNDDSNSNNNDNNLKRNIPVWLSFENRGASEPYWYGGAAEQTAARVVGGSSYSCVTVECVTDTWVEEEGMVLGGTDEERRVNLGEDTCPGFISDGYGRVTWTNGAYREMVGQKESEGAVVVLLAMKVGAVVPYPRSITCRVRVVQYDSGKERSSLTVPCDVWRMDSGGFAWRLDLKAALSLRLGC